MDEWLLRSMADNDTFEWIDVLNRDVLAGDGYIPGNSLGQGSTTLAVVLAL